jgi:transposase
MTVAQREALQTIVESLEDPPRDILRARVLLLAADGLANSRIAQQVDVAPATVRAWRRRFTEDGLARFGRVRPGRGRKRAITQSKVDEIIRLTRFDRPEGRDRWSVRSMARRVGVSAAQVQRIWAAHGLKPHRDDGCEPTSETRVVDLVGLCLAPPDKAMVLCLDAETSEQTLEQDRSNTVEASPTPAERRSQRSRRSQIDSTLFSVLNVACAKITAPDRLSGQTPRLFDFLKTVDLACPSRLDLHLLVEGPAARRQEAVTACLKRHPRSHLHFAADSAWCQLVERWLRRLDARSRRQPILASAPELITAVEHHLGDGSDQPPALVWIAQHRLDRGGGGWPNGSGVTPPTAPTP